MRLRQSIEQHEGHAARAEELLAGVDRIGASELTFNEQAMLVLAANAHASLALYWQGEAREAREARDAL